QHTGQGTAEARQVRGSIALGYVVGVGIDIFQVAVIPLHRHLNANIIGLGREMENLVDGSTVLVQIINEDLQATVIVEGFNLFSTLVGQFDGDTGIQEGQLTQFLGQDVIIKFDIGKGFHR